MHDQNFNEIASRIWKILEHLLPSDFKMYHDVAINGQIVPVLAVSPCCGVVAVFIAGITAQLKECFGNADNTKKTRKILNKEQKKQLAAYLSINSEKFKSIITIPNNLHLPETKYISGDFTNRECGVLVITAIDVDCDNIIQCVLSDNDIIERNNFISGRSLNAGLERFIRKYLTYHKPHVAVEWVFQNIQAWLTSEDIAELNIKLNSEQEQLVNSRTRSGRRRIRGAAGCGKSLVLAARGARLLKEGKKVLFITYNIVASCYLRELVSKILAKDKKHLQGDKATFLHFHGLLGSYIPWDRFVFDTSEERMNYLEIGWNNRVIEYFKKYGFPKYDAIFIDEGQDFRVEWFKLILSLVSVDGEIMFAADISQNIYGRRPIEESIMNGAGFRGRWNQLKGCYRMPPQIIESARDFINRFLRGDVELPEHPKERKGHLFALNMQWIQVSDKANPEDAASIAFKEYLSLLTTSERYKNLPEKDVVFMTCSDRCGYALENEFSINDVTYYSTIGNKEAKLGFSMQCPGVKIATIRSFKGLQSRIIFIIAEQGISPVELYVAMTRVLDVQYQFKYSIITVLCMDNKYAEYGKTWAQHGGTFKDLRENDISHFVKNVIVKKSGTKADIIIGRDFFEAVMRLSNTIQDKRAVEKNSNDCCNILDVNKNLYNSHYQNIAYLHDYFFRSYTENYIFWKNMFCNTVYLEHIHDKTELNLLFYGCGTGGDIVGFIEAINNFCSFNGKLIFIHAVDGNQDALDKCMRIVDGINILRKFKIKLIIDTSVCIANQNCFPLPPNVSKYKFDIIVTSKMINEVIQLNHGAYFMFLNTVVRQHLRKDGLALITDVPVPRYTRTEKFEGILSDKRKVWVPKHMTQAVSNFIKNNPDFSVILPLVCAGCNVYCYSAKLYTYRFFDDDAHLVMSPVCCRLLARVELARKLRAHGDDEGYFATCYRKDGIITCCKRGGIENNVSYNEAKDGYVLP